MGTPLCRNRCAIHDGLGVGKARGIGTSSAYEKKVTPVKKPLGSRRSIFRDMRTPLETVALAFRVTTALQRFARGTGYLLGKPFSGLPQ